MDKEAKELMQTLADIEDRIISDDVIIETMHTSITKLQKIFGKNSPWSKLLEGRKSAYKINELKKLIEKKLFAKRENLMIEPANARVIIDKIKVTKNSVLSDYLADTGKISNKKLKEFHEFFKDTGGYIDTAFEKKDPEEVKRVLKEYIALLEKEEEFLKENLDKMRSDVDNLWSLERILSHELAHILFLMEFQTKNWYATQLDEAHSFALQLLLPTFEKNYIFTPEQLKKDIKELYKFIHPRKLAYGKKYYIFMRPFILLLFAFVLCDSITRKEGDYRNKKLFLKSYSVYTFGELYALLEQAKENLPNEEYKQIIEEQLIQVAINQLKKCKDTLIQNSEKWIEELPNLEKEKSLDFTKKNKGETIKWKDWKNLKAALTPIVANNLRHFVASMDLLKIMGYEKIAEEYKTRYLTALEEVINKILSKVSSKEAAKYEQEKGIVDVMLAALEAEEEELAEICKALG